jgi:hypothetical protein
MAQMHQLRPTKLQLCRPPRGDAGWQCAEGTRTGATTGDQRGPRETTQAEELPWGEEGRAGHHRERVRHSPGGRKLLEGYFGQAGNGKENAPRANLGCARPALASAQRAVPCSPARRAAGLAPPGRRRRAAARAAPAASPSRRRTSRPRPPGTGRRPPPRRRRRPDRPASVPRSPKPHPPQPHFRPARAASPARLHFRAVN